MIDIPGDSKEVWQRTSSWRLRFSGKFF